MTTYKFETIDTSSSGNAEDVAFALISAFGALASTVVGNDEEKQAELFRKFDQALADNEGATSYVELASISKITKFALTGQR
ncbi:hypothetical protein I7877_001132 [Salmonella enterica]|nr:hypothetical protein [Salmonella enterica]